MKSQIRRSARRAGPVERSDLRFTIEQVDMSTKAPNPTLDWYSPALHHWIGKFVCKSTKPRLRLIFRRASPLNRYICPWVHYPHTLDWYWPALYHYTAISVCQGTKPCLRLILTCASPLNRYLCLSKHQSLPWADISLCLTIKQIYLSVNAARPTLDSYWPALHHWTVIYVCKNTKPHLRLILTCASPLNRYICLSKHQALP